MAASFTGFRWHRVLRFVVLGLFLATVPARGDVFVEALLPGLAVLQIDGQRVTLREGQRKGKVLLVSADARSALVEIDGAQSRLGVSERIATQFSKPAERSVSIPRNQQLQYATTAEINGVRLPVIIDTGANIVAMNAQHAAAAGIGGSEGSPSQVQTAGSVVPARRILLDTVDVGGLRVDSVDATVIEGPHPAVVLLGMSYLKHMDLEDRGGILTLRARW